MNSVTKLIENLKQSEISKIVNQKQKEFKELGKRRINDIFNELCFCILTANFSAEGGIKIQNSIKDGFLKLNQEQIAEKLKILGHRFPNARTKFIIDARNKLNEIEKILSSSISEQEKREWFVKNINGLGMKEASHFLRNIGYENLAIIDFHIIDFLVKNSL